MSGGCGGNSGGSSLNPTCEMMPYYTPCGECGLPNGYPKGKLVKISYGGQCWVAQSMECDNTVNPVEHIGNTDPSKAWVVLRFPDYLEWLVDSKMKKLNESIESLKEKHEEAIKCIYDKMKEGLYRDCDGNKLPQNSKVTKCS